MTPETKLVALFGQPVAHSLSPPMFNTVFEKLGENRRYVPFNIDASDLGKAVDAARVLKFDGFNVTMPYKTKVPDLLDGLDATAGDVGAVNTVSKTENGLIGYNTDGEGAERAIKAYGIRPKDLRVLVIGAGGSARAIVHRLSREVVRLKILNRDLDRARHVAEETGHGKVSFGKLGRAVLEKELEETDLLINTTPIPSLTVLDELGIPIKLPNGVDWIFDLSYDKPKSVVASRASRISALEMLLQQAGLSYRIWFERDAPLDLMRAALINHVGEDWR